MCPAQNMPINFFCYENCETHISYDFSMARLEQKFNYSENVDSQKGLKNQITTARNVHSYGSLLILIKDFVLED